MKRLPKRLPIFEGLDLSKIDFSKFKVNENPSQSEISNAVEYLNGANFYQFDGMYRSMIDGDLNQYDAYDFESVFDDGKIKNNKELVKFLVALCNLGKDFVESIEIDSYGDSEENKDQFPDYPHIEEHEIDHILFAYFFKHEVNFEWGY